MRAVWGRCALALLLMAVGPALAQTPGGGQVQKDVLDPLLKASCPAGVERLEPEVIALQAKRVPLQGLNRSRKTIGALTFVDGFHLTSGDKRFGGLSGLDFTDDGGLLAVSDLGDFVWIGLAEDGVAPVNARIAAMRDADGAALRGKVEGDAEGVAVNGGVALVSFEGTHRVLAFDLDRCGAAARGVAAPRLTAGVLSSAFARQKLEVGSNDGVEGLAVTPDWFVLAGVEASAGTASALSARAIEVRPEFDMRIADGAPNLVGLDALADGDDLLLYSLHRSRSALASNAIVVVETRLMRELDQAGLPARVVSERDERSRVTFRAVATRVLAQMNVFLTIDNFEGIAARRMPDGRVRLFIVSDDNFSASQRTLLMVYNVAAQG